MLPCVLLCVSGAKVDGLFVINDFARSCFRTTSGIASCRRDERNLRRDERVVRVGQGVVFDIEAS